MTILEANNGELVAVGIVEGLGKGERIYSVRFIDETAYIVIFETNGLQVGSDVEGLDELSWREDESFGEPTALQSGTFDIPIEHEWGTGQLFVRQAEPLPATILLLGSKIEGEV